MSKVIKVYSADEQETHSIELKIDQSNLDTKIQKTDYETSTQLSSCESDKESRHDSKNQSFLNTLMSALGDPVEIQPSTPKVDKFRTEMCKNFETTGQCRFGDNCSFAHSKNHLMIKTDLPSQYKTKQCKKFQLNGYCPYGQRCMFMHGKQDNILTRKYSDVTCENQFECLFESTTKYTDILIHNLQVSYQEQQKKKAFSSSRENLYTNIYKTKRLNVFKNITLDQSEEDCNNGETSSLFGNYNYLMVPELYDNGYMSDPSPIKPNTRLNPYSTVFKPTL